MFGLFLPKPLFLFLTFNFVETNRTHVPLHDEHCRRIKTDIRKCKERIKPKRNRAAKRSNYYLPKSLFPLFEAASAK